jgi:transcription elongation GreA/GreB family factor
MQSVDKKRLVAQIIEQLKQDHYLLLQAATAAHAAATHAENIPDSKYETLSIEASYIAQGQANRAQEILLAIDCFRTLELKTFLAESAIRLGAIVLLEEESREQRRIFLGPAAGGMKLKFAGAEIMVITPDSPLGANLLGKKSGEEVELMTAGKLREYEILQIW